MGVIFKTFVGGRVMLETGVFLYFQNGQKKFQASHTV